MNTTAPPPDSFKDGRHARVIRSEPSRFISMTDCQVVKSASSRPPKYESHAATCTTASIRPNRSRASAASASQRASSVMSVARYAVRVPPGSMSAAVFARFASVRAPSTAFPPSRTTAAATRCPSPAPTPDTTTVFPVSSGMAASRSGVLPLSRSWRHI